MTIPDWWLPDGDANRAGEVLSPCWRSDPCRGRSCLVAVRPVGPSAEAATILRGLGLMPPFGGHGYYTWYCRRWGDLHGSYKEAIASPRDLHRSRSHDHSRCDPCGKGTPDALDHGSAASGKLGLVSVQEKEGGKDVGNGNGGRYCICAAKAREQRL